jgi:hypothetical protein
LLAYIKYKFEAVGRVPRVLGSSEGFGHQGWAQLECNGKQKSLVPKKGGGHEIEASQNLELSIERGCRLDFGDITCQLLTATILQMFMHALEHVFCRKYWSLVSGKLKVIMNTVSICLERLL